MTIKQNLSAHSARSRRWVRFILPALVSAFAVVLATAFGVAMTLNPQAHAATSCPKFEILGVRGAGETAADGPYSMGSTAGGAADSAMRHLLSQGYTTADISLQPVNYTAIAVPDWLHRDLAAYDASVNDGEQVLSLLMATKLASTACPHVRFILIGYSQGAQVVHEVVNSYGAAAPELKAIAGVLLIADPKGDDSAYYAHMVGTDFGGDEGSGSGGGIAGQDRIQATLAHRTFAICFASGDSVCASNFPPTSSNT
jgi:hypothetical protein